MKGYTCIINKDSEPREIENVYYVGERISSGKIFKLTIQSYYQNVKNSEEKLIELYKKFPKQLKINTISIYKNDFYTEEEEENILAENNSNNTTNVTLTLNDEDTLIQEYSVFTNLGDIRIESDSRDYGIFKITIEFYSNPIEGL